MKADLKKQSAVELTKLVLVIGLICLGKLLSAEGVKLKGVKQVAAGGAFTCVIQLSGTLACWGSNVYGVMGKNHPKTVKYVAQLIDAPKNLKKAAAGGGSICVLTKLGSVFCRGANNYGQVGDGSVGGIRKHFSKVKGLSKVRDIASGTAHVCALMKDSTVRCWGKGVRGELGAGVNEDFRAFPAPVKAAKGVGNLKGIARIAAGNAHTCAVSKSGGLICWGDNLLGQLGAGSDAEQSNLPKRVAKTNGRARNIAVGKAHSCALMASGSVYCWGAEGLLGDGTGVQSSTPLKVKFSGGGKAKSISAGLKHTCAIMSDSSVKCWGNADRYQLGHRSIRDDEDYWNGLAVPVEWNDSTKGDKNVVYLVQKGVRSVSSGGFHSCALMKDSTVRCWGANRSYQVSTQFIHHPDMNACKFSEVMACPGAVSIYVN